VQQQDPAAIVALCRDDAEVASWPLARSSPADLAVVDELARLLLAARRMGYSIRLRDACTGFLELLDLVGLKDLVTEAGLGQMDGQVEGREELGVDEVVMPDDPVA
jgi:hypothetical protein